MKSTAKSFSEFGKRSSSSSSDAMLLAGLPKIKHITEIVRHRKRERERDALDDEEND